MSRRVRLTCFAALASVLGLAPAHAAQTDGRQFARHAAPAGQQLAQQANPYDRFAIPKPSERRTGELEGWTEPKKDGKPGAAPSGKAKPKAAQAAAKPAKPAPTRDADDGGLPLPRARGEDRDAPVGFDSKGNIGTGFKF